MKMVQLEEVCDIKNGYAFKSDDFIDDGIPIIRIGNINEELIDIQTVASIKEDEKYNNYLIDYGSILIAMSGATTGKIGRYFKKEKAYQNQRVGCFKPNMKLLNNDYLYFLLKRSRNVILKKAYGGGQPNISPKHINALKIPLPPLDDQKRIAAVLTRAEQLIAKRKESIALLDEFLKSTFLEMFGDPEINPKEYKIHMLSDFYIDSKNGTKCGPFGSALKKDEIVTAGIPVWNMDNISIDYRMILPFRMWITNEKYKELESYGVQNGDIIISRAGTVGKMCVVNMEQEKSIISTNLIRVRLNSELLPIYFVSLMKYCKSRVGRLKTGADGSFTHMNTGILDKLLFPYPPIELQRQFSILVDRVEKVKTKCQESFDELESLYGSLSQRAFKGELDLRGVGA